ncbi:MAG: hypothetical protein ACRCYQ_01345, partial [Nocardioides sp.]
VSRCPKLSGDHRRGNRTSLDKNRLPAQAPGHQASDRGFGPYSDARVAREVLAEADKPPRPHR